MKKHILLYFLLLLFTMLSNAQNTINQEIRLSFADGIHNPFNSRLTQAIRVYIPQAADRSSLNLKTKSFGNFALGYLYGIHDRFNIGLELNYQ